MSKNVVEPERPRLACLIIKATRAQAHARAPTATHTEIRNTYGFSTTTLVSRTRLSVTLCVHCLSCLITASCIRIFLLHEVL